MKVLYYTWSSFFERDVREIFHKSGVEYDLISWKFEDKNIDDKFVDYIEKNIEVGNYDAVFSINYWPLLSVICQKNSIPYIAWCYDAPLDVKDIELTLGNSVNHVFCFDRIQADGYRLKGFPVEHLTLGVNTDRYSKISITDPKCRQYKTDVSFIGKLYESATGWIMSRVSDYCKGYMRAVIEAQQKLYGAYLLDDVITDVFLDEVNKSLRLKNKDSYKDIQKNQLVYALACEVTRRDRIIILSLMGARHKTKFYSYNDSSVIKGVERCHTVDYWETMPYVFAASKINLNPSLRAIQSGIPLRALDIMACGGFLLSNFQQEMFELFENEKELVMYENYQDAVEKAGFYIANEDKRMKIAQNGRDRVLRDFSMRDRLKYMFKNV